MGTGDERGDIGICEITLLDRGKARGGGVVVGCANGCIKISGPHCRGLEH
jgi:hypothetical protein